MPKRQRLATGIYKDANGISVIYHAHGAPVETRFEADRPLDFLIRWRKRQIADVSETPPARRGSLARDVVTFLKTRKGLANYKTEKSNLKAWIAALDNPQRWTITAGDIQRVMADWREAGYSPQTLRHRFRILRQLFQTLDGRRASSPFDDLPMPEKPRPRPVSVADTDIAQVATNLRRQEIIHRLHDGKTRARFLVLATHEQRPAELKRTLPGDVDLTRRIWFVRGAKGSYHTIVPLNDEQLAAWQLFAAAKAWGRFDTRNFSRVVQHAGWPKHVRVYNLRHSTGFALSARGVDLGDIQALYGHTSPDTTRIYVPGQMRRLEAAQARLEGRFGATPFFPRSVSTKVTGADAKGAEKPGNPGTAKPRLSAADRRRIGGKR
jgi:site-specific recombinase XerD